MTDFLHILDRFAIHFVSATALVLCAATALRVAAKRWSQWLPADWRHRLVIAGLTVFAISTMREAWDVAHGQLLIKAFVDYASWVCGCGFGVWGLYRFKKDS